MNRLLILLVCATAVNMACAEDTNRSDTNTGTIQFKKQHVSAEKAESCAFGDFDGDGHQDIASGSYWIRGPKFEERIHFRKLRLTIPTKPRSGLSPDDFTLSRDVDGDGFDDVVSGGHDYGLFWYKSPGTTESGLWERIVIDAERPPKGISDIESYEHNIPYHSAVWVDIDNDGRAEEIVSEGMNTRENINLRWMKYEDGAWKKYDTGQQSIQWGSGVGDINGDGRADIVCPDAWFEAPEDPRSASWIRHPHTMSVCVVDDDPIKRMRNENGVECGHVCCMYVYDVNQDGLNDFMASVGHGSGIFWYEQKRTTDGQITFVEHLIDNSWAMSHNLHFRDMDLDNDPDLVTGKRGPGGRAGKENALYWYELEPGSANLWTRHVISYNEKIGFGTGGDLKDIDGDGDLDIAATTRDNGCYLLTNQLKQPEKNKHTSSNVLPKEARGLCPFSMGGLKEKTGSETAALLTEIGYAGIILRPNNVQHLNEYLDVSDSYGEKFQVHAVYMAHNMKLQGRNLGKITAIIDALAARGGGTLWMSIKQGGSTEPVETANELYQQVVEYAAGKNVDVVIYPHGGDYYYTNAKPALALINQIDNPRFKVMINLPHELGAKEEDALEETFEKAKGKIGAVVLTGAKSATTGAAVPLSLSKYDLRKFMGLIRDSEWKGPIGFINPFRESFHPDDGIPFPQDYLTHDIEEWKKLCDEVGLLNETEDETFPRDEAGLFNATESRPSATTSFQTMELNDFTTTGNWSQADDGVISLIPRKGEKGSKRYSCYLYSKQQYKNFECKFEYKQEKNSNSGFFFHIADQNDPAAKGIEVQIRDSREIKQLRACDCAGIIRGPAATKNMSKPAGEWNKMTVRLIDKQITVTHNGEIVQDVDLNQTPLKNIAEKGYIAFQDHGQKFWVRNIKIKAL